MRHLLLMATASLAVACTPGSSEPGWTGSESASTGTPPRFVDTGTLDTGTTFDSGVPARGTVTQVSEEAARLIADRFLLSDLRYEDEEDLDGSSLGDPVLFLDIDGMPSFYEFPVLRGGVDFGYVSVSATEELGVVLSASYGSGSLVSALRTRLQGATDFDFGEGDLLYIGVSPPTMAVAVEVPPSNHARTDAASTVFINGSTLAVASPVAIDERTFLDEFSLVRSGVLDRMTTQQRVDASELRQAYLEYSDSKLDTLLWTQPETDGDQGVVAWATSGRTVSHHSAFSDLYQILGSDTYLGRWSTGGNPDERESCYTGCAPLAATILAEYYDRNGYAGQVGSTSDNANGSNTDPDTQWTEDQFRYDMGTTCTGTTTPHDGSTFVSRVGRGFIDHANSRGSGTWGNTNYYSSVWSALKSEIDARRTLLLSYGTSSYGHTAVAYRYTNNRGSASDFIYIKTGWSTPIWTKFSRTSVSLYGAHAISVR